ncbi:cell division regulator GpsB [Pseudogracilibacillus sp. SE30717A]|uniref:cell division regulator GpsB n=1 Tax=Pseudogracilibacillus sp. SE30717A TaxID=3098293 RepID=UPI00300E1C07
MTVNRVQLSVNDILEKEFKKSMRGYNEEDVDEFLDIIIQDYEALNAEIERLRQENERFKKSSDHQQPVTRRQTTQPQANYDVLKRLSNLEKAVFGQKLNEKEG